jgi:hypothetical protein
LASGLAWRKNLLARVLNTNHKNINLRSFGYPGRSPAGLEVNFTINPSGSQNLEPK